MVAMTKQEREELVAEIAVAVRIRATDTVFDAHGGSSVIANPAIAHDAQERAEAQALIDAATQGTLDLHALRHPAPPEEVEP